MDIERSKEHIEVMLIIQDVRYEMAFANGQRGIKELLNSWLSDWLARKSDCPKCGNHNEEY